MSFTGESGSVTSSGDRMFPFVLPHDRPHPHWNNFPSPASSVNKLSLSSKQLHFQFKPISICGKLLMKWIQFQRWFVSSPPKVQTFEYSGPFILYNRYEIPSDRTCTEPCTVPPLKAKHPTGGASNPLQLILHLCSTHLGACCPCCAAAAWGSLEINYGCNAKAVKFVVSSIIFMLKATKALQWSQPLRNDRYCYQASL